MESELRKKARCTHAAAHAFADDNTDIDYHCGAFTSADDVTDFISDAVSYCVADDGTHNIAIGIADVRSVSCSYS